MKNVLSFALAFVFVIGVCFSAPFTLKANAASVSVLTFELKYDAESYDGESYYSVTDCIEGASGKLMIPSKYNGLPVKNISSYAFQGCTNLTSVAIPDSVRNIGYSAFSGCTSLTSITIPDSVRNIGYSAFSGCTSLTSVTIPDGVTSIDDRAFMDCTSLTSITIPNSVRSINQYAFSGCTSLTSVTISDGVIRIDDRAFMDCTSLTSVTIPNSVTSIGEDAFDGCSKLKDVYIEDIVAWCNIDFGYYSSNPLCYADNLYLNGELVTDVVIPDGVTDINDYAFKWCKSLESVTIPDSVTSIGDDAFYGCENLKGVYIEDIATWCNIDFDDYDSNPLSCAANLYLNGELVTDVVIPDGVERIPVCAFYGCDSLTSVRIPNSVTSIDDRAFHGCRSLTSVTIPDSVTSIGSLAFYECYGLTSITMPNNVRSIGSNAFDDTALYYNASNWEKGVLYIGDYLIEVENSINGEYAIKDGVTSIGSSAFNRCTSLTSVTIPDSVTSIGSHAFYNCTSLKSITIPDSVTSIGSYAFSYCSSLESITIPNSVRSIGSNAFDDTALYNNASNWENGVLYIGDYLIKAENSINGEYAIKDGTKLILGSAFGGRRSLTSITIPDSITSIGSDAFWGCSGLKDVYIEDIAAWCNINFEDYDSNPLYYAGKLYLNGELVTDLVIPEGVTTISECAFYNCESLTSVKIPDGVTTIEGYAFCNCSSLESVTIPDSVTSIGSHAFECCFWNNLGSVKIGGGITSIGEYAFKNCYGLTSVTIPDSVTSIGDYAFYYCYGLTSVTIPDSVTRIGEYAFYSCDGLTSVTIPDSVTSIGEYAFYSCDGLTSITIPDSVRSIGQYAFYSCGNIKYIFYEGSSVDWNKIEIDSYNDPLTSCSIHFNSTNHSHNATINKPLNEATQGSIEDKCTVCGFIHRQENLMYVNEYIATVDYTNTTIDTNNDFIVLDISNSSNLTQSIFVMDGYTLNTIPNSDYGYYGTGSKVQVADSTGTQVDEYTLVVRGDVNGDSVCDVLDCMLIELARNNHKELNGIYLNAGDLTENGSIDVYDFEAVVNKAIA